MSEQVVWIFAWIFLLIMGGVTMIGVYLIFVRRHSSDENADEPTTGQKKNDENI